MSLKVPQPPMTLLEAIARMEGFYEPNSRSQRNNNPGDIEWGSYAAKIGGATRIEEIPEGIDEKPRFAYFPDPLTGFKGMQTLLRLHYGKRTLIEMIRGVEDGKGGYVDGWAPAPENDPVHYCSVVCMWTGLNFNSIVGTCLQLPNLDTQDTPPEAA
jgi:hypothetical protein